MCRNVALGDPQRAEFARATDLRWQRWLWLEMNVRVRLVRCNILPATPALQRWRKFMQEKKHHQKTVANFLPEDCPKIILEACRRAAGDLWPCNMVRMWTSSLSGGPMRGAFSVAGLVLAPMRPGQSPSDPAEQAQ